MSTVRTVFGLKQNQSFHFMKKTETITIIRPWLGGNNQYSLYITIPSKIVKMMNISEDTVLEVGILENQTITISKYQDSKKSNIQKDNTIIDSTQKSVEEKQSDMEQEESDNPLKDLKI